MRSVFRLPISAIAAAAAVLIVAGCGGGGGGGGSSTTAQTRNLVGRVFNAANGSPVSGASVQLGNRSATTDASGVYRMDDFADTFTGGTLQVTNAGFLSATATVSLQGSALQAPPVGMTPSGTPVSITPSAGGTVSQSVAEVPGMASAALNIPAGALQGAATVSVTLTPVVNQPGDALVAANSVSAQAVGDVASQAPEIMVEISPANQTLNAGTHADVTVPLPFALPAGSTIPLLQFKNSAWREVGNATVDASGATATGPISEFAPTGAHCWHAFSYSESHQPDVALQEVTLASIQNDINNLPDRSYVINRVLEAGRRADITARFRWTFQSPTLPTVPVNEEVLCLGTTAYRNILGDYFASGEWNMAGGPVVFNLSQATVTVGRFIRGQRVNDAGSFVATWGTPDWPVPSSHNQGGVQ